MADTAPPETGDRAASGDHRLETAAIAGMAGCLAVLSALITAEGSESQLDWLQALARACIVATPIAVGLYARQRASSRRFGGLLIGAGALLFLTTFAEADSDTL